MYRPIVNKIRCKQCGDIIESFSVHDFKKCRCGKCCVDGGHDYARRGWEGNNPNDIFEDLSIYYDTDTEKFIPARNMKPDIIKTLKMSQPTKAPKPTQDISEEPEALEAEVLKEEKIVKRDENGKAIAGRYPFGKKG